MLVLDQWRQGKGKLSDRWEKQPHVVIARPYPDCPVYKIRPEGKGSPERILHRNSLRPCLPCLALQPAETTEHQARENHQ